MVASRYVIDKILKRWGNPRGLRDEFEKFSKRYPNDTELQRIYKEFQNYLRINTNKSERIKIKLSRLEENRRIR